MNKYEVNTCVWVAESRTGNRDWLGKGVVRVGPPPHTIINFIFVHVKNILLWFRHPWVFDITTPICGNCLNLVVMRRHKRDSNRDPEIYCGHEKTVTWKFTITYVRVAIRCKEHPAEYLVPTLDRVWYKINWWPRLRSHYFVWSHGQSQWLSFVE